MRLALILLALAVATIASAMLEPVGVLAGPVPVLDVVDGDTVVLASNLGPRVVRLIGIDAPESGGEAMAHQATEFLEGLIPEGAMVHVEFDLELEDAYGRLLAYLYVEDAAGAWTVRGVRATMVNLAMARAGFARTLTIAPNSMYADLFAQAVEDARAAGRGLWQQGGADSGGAPATVDTGSASEPIVIRCAMYDPVAEMDAGAEWVAVELRERLDTRGYYLWDEGSRTTLALPPGEHGPGELRIVNPGQGIWNNGGDTIYLMRAGEVIDAWDYSPMLSAEGAAACRNEP